MARFTKRGKVWQYEISYKTPEGKYKKIRKSGFPKKSDAILAASEIETKIGKGFNLSEKDITLYDYFKQWMEIYKKGKISDVTYLKYVNILMNIKKYFKNDTVKTLTRTKYQQVINEYSKTHATKTAERFNAIIKASIINLIDEGVIPLDFTKGAIIKGVNNTDKNKGKYLNYKEFKSLMKIAKEKSEPTKPSSFLIFLAGMTGMRFAELLGLTWDNIDLEKETINICQTWDYHLKTGFSTTKNEQSNRIISIDHNTAEFIKKFKSKQNKWLRDMEYLNKNNLVFFSNPHSMMSNGFINKELTKLCDTIGLNTYVTIHGLRHTHASVLLYKDINILAVSKRLGHKNISITMTVYTHILRELEEKENKQISSILEQV